MTAPRTANAEAPGSIELRNLTLGYDRHPAVHHLSLTLSPGMLVAVVGPNGAGKSTLIKALVGQLKPLQGQILGLTGQRVAYMPQLAEVDRSFPISVRDLVAMGLWHEVGAFRRLTPAHLQRCTEALAAVGLAGFESRALDTLSGGQFQRALFARLMLQDAPVLLLDEPFAAVDSRTTADLVALLRRWHAAGKTVVAVLHDAALVRAHFPHTLVIAREAVAWGPTEQAFSDANWQRALSLHEAFDDQAPVCHDHETETAPEARA